MAYIQKEVSQVFVHEKIAEYVVKLVNTTRNNSNIELGVISSASRRLHITAPDLYTNSFFALSNIVNPVISDGITSVVN